MSAVCFCAALALLTAACFSAEPAGDVLCLAAFFFVGLGWALWLFLDSD